MVDRFALLLLLGCVQESRWTVGCRYGPTYSLLPFSHFSQADVRRHALLMLGRTNSDSLVPEPPFPDEIEHFDETGEGGPSDEVGELRVDVCGPVRSAWNKVAAQQFRRAFQKSHPYSCWREEDVEEAFLRHMETIRSHYRKQNGSVPASEVNYKQSRAARRARLKTVRILPFVILRHDAHSLFLSSQEPGSQSATPCQPWVPSLNLLGSWRRGV